MRVGEEDSITKMELLPIVLVSAVWGPAWRGQRIIVHCDNTGAVTVTNSRYSRVPLTNHAPSPMPVLHQVLPQIFIPSSTHRGN